MNIRQIECFIALSEELNFTKASERLFITQQTLSETISKLEMEYGTKLFNRSRPLSLTPQGQAALPFAYRFIENKDKLEAAFAGKDTSDTLTFGILRTRSGFVIPEVLPVFKKSFPLVRFQLVTENHATLEHMLMAGAVDLIMGIEQFSNDNITQITIARERTYLLVPATLINSIHGVPTPEQLKQWENGVSLQDFGDYPFLFRRQMCSSRALADALFADQDLRPNIVFESNDNDTLFRLCLNGMGAMFLSSFLLQMGDKLDHVRNGELYCFPVASERSFRKILIGHPINRELRPCELAFIESFRSVHEKYNETSTNLLLQDSSEPENA